MAFAQNPIYMDAMEQLQPPLQLEMYDYNRTLCRICGDSVSNLEAHLHTRHNQRPRRRRSRRSQRLIKCEHCLNKMEKSSMKGHLLRKHNISSNEENSKAVKRKRTETVGADFEAIDQQIIKRQCPNVNQTITDDLNDTFISQSQTQANENLAVTAISETTEGTHGNQEATHLPIVKFEQKIFNLVHISDQELNKLMLNGRIRIQNGYLYMNDSEPEQTL